MTEKKIRINLHPNKAQPKAQPKSQPKLQPKPQPKSQQKDVIIDHDGDVVPDVAGDATDLTGNKWI